MSVYDTGKTAESFVNNYPTNGCVSQRICNNCLAIIVDPICLCMGIFICPRCQAHNDQSFLRNTNKTMIDLKSTLEGLGL